MSELEIKLEAALRKNLADLKKAQNKLNTLERMQHEPIAVIGMGCRLPAGANDPESYWDLLSQGRDGISEVPKNRWDIDAFYDPDPDAPGKMITRKAGFMDHIDLFDAEFFRISHREAQSMDPQQRILLEVVWEALERAGIAPASLENSLTGVFIGASYSDHSALIQRAQLDKLGTYSALSISLSALNGRISYGLGLLGPSMTVDTACSSSLTSLNLACTSLQRGECNLAIAGGVYVMLSPAVFIMLSRAKMLAADGHCKTFDASGDGYARGEGAGVLILKRLSDAERDHDNILAIIRASAVNQDGPSSGLTVPNRVAQVQLMEKTLSDAKLKSTDISYVEAHGTGTELGDPIEVAAIKDVYGKERLAENPLFLGSVKSNIGHLEGAAGIAGLIKIILSIEHEALPPNLNFTHLNPKINLDAIPAKIITSLTSWKPEENRVRRAAISAFGFTGTNAHAIVEEYVHAVHEKSTVEDPPLHILTLSAKTEAALNALISRYQEFLEKTQENLADICYTANVGRNHERFRVAILAQDLDDLKLQIAESKYRKGEVKTTEPRDIAFSGDWKVFLKKLADDYVKGIEIDWKKFYLPYLRKKVILPTYPFQKTAFPIIGVISPEEKSLSGLEFFYDWQSLAYELPDVHLEAPLGHWLVFVDEKTSPILLEQFKIYQGTCRFVSLASIPKTKEDFLVLLQEEKIDGILHFSGTGEQGELSSAEIQRAQTSSTESLLNLTQALIQLQETLRISLFIVSSKNLIFSPLEGLFKTIFAEHPELSMKLIYLEEKWDASLLFKALFDPSDEIIFNLGEQAATVPRLQRLSEVEDQKLNIRNDSTYLITGALGELGLCVAKWLVEKNAGRVVLTGRRQPDASILKNLEEPGTEIRYELLDISNEKAVETLLASLNQSTKPLKGIFHLAGILDDATFLDLDWPRFEKVFASKVYGSYYLHQYSKNLDYFVLFSSLASTLGSAGQGNYASACAFMDALAAYRRTQGLPAHSLSWGPWAEIGMAKDLVARHARAGFLGIKPKEGILALEKAITLKQAHITIANMDWKKYIEHLIKPPSWIKLFGSKEVSLKNFRVELEGKSTSEKVPFIQAYVTEIIRDVFAVPESQVVDAKMGFFDMGIDSLMAVEIKNRLQFALGKEPVIDNVAIFNYPSIETMSQHLAELLHLGVQEEKRNEEELKKEAIEKSVDEMNIEDVISKLRGKSDGE